MLRLRLPNFTAVDPLPVTTEFPYLRNHPNPFNPSTRIDFVLQSAGRITMQIYDLQGRLVRELLSSTHFSAGAHSVSWEGRDDDVRLLPSGLYLCRLTKADQVMTARLLLLK